MFGVVVKLPFRLIHNRMIEYLQFRAKGISFYKGLTNGRAHTLIKTKGLTPQSLTLLQALGARRPRHFIDPTARISICGELYLVVPLLRLYQPLQKLTHRELLLLLLNTVDCYLQLNSILSGILGRKANGLKIIMSPDSLFVNQYKEVLVFDLEVTAEHKDGWEAESVKEVMYYLAGATEGSFDKRYPGLEDLPKVAGLGDAHKTIRTLLKKIDGQQMARSLGGLTLRAKTEDDDKENIIIKRSYSIAKNNMKLGPLQKQEINRNKSKQNCILEPFLREQNLNQPNQSARGIKKKSSRRRLNQNNTIFNLTQNSKVLSLTTNKTKPFSIQSNSTKLTLDIGRRRNTAGVVEQEFTPFNIGREDKSQNILIRHSNAIQIDDITIDKLQSRRQTKHLQDQSLIRHPPPIPQVPPCKSSHSDPDTLSPLVCRSRSSSVTQPPGPQPNDLSVIESIVSRYNIIGELVAQAKQFFDKKMSWKPGMYLLYKKFIQLRVCLVACLEDADNVFGLSDWAGVRASDQYKMLVTKIEQENQEIVRVAGAMKGNLKINDSRLTNEVLDLSKNCPEFDKVLFQWNYNLYLNLKEVAIQEKRKTTMPFLCRYLTCLAICEDFPMQLLPEQTGLAQLVSFMSKAEQKLDHLNFCYKENSS